MKITHTRIGKDQQGVITIVVVILIMLLMSLIVLAMSRNANREQRQALDRQLSNQAFYAAESGINDLLKGLSNPDLPDDSNNCDNGFAGPLLPDSSIEVTCVIYDKTPDTLVFGNIKLGGAKITPIQTNDPGGIDILNISFEGKDVSDPKYNGCDNFNSNHFPPNPVDECDVGVLRLEIIRTDNPTRDNLLNKTTTIFIVPRESGGAGSYNYVAGDQGEIVRANCSTDNTPRDCNIDIDLSNISIDHTGLGPNQRMYLSMRSIYQPNTLEIGSNAGSFTNAQIIADSTGKANDVLKRIQTAIPVSALSNAENPSFSVQSATGICKLLQVRPNNTTISCDID